MMRSESDSELYEKLAAAGLAMTGFVQDEALPSPGKAWSVVSRGDVVPVTAFACPDNGEFTHFTELTAAWIRRAREATVLSADGSFLLSVGGLGALPWARVKLAPTIFLRDLPRANEPEFVAMNLEGTHLCAITTEEHEFWIITSLVSA